MSLAAGLNRVWMQFCQRELAGFQRATTDLEAAQAKVLREILLAGRGSAFGREYRFESVRTPAEFQSRVPLADYDTLRPWIDRAAAGEAKVLTTEAVKLFQPTSGTTTAEKLIPYTATLQRQYQRGINTWIGDLFRNRPSVRQGRAYWSISPALGTTRTTLGGISIGFDDDAAYLGRLMQLAMRQLLVAPSRLSRIVDLRSFRVATLCYLLSARDLSLVSIWNPSFLMVLLAHWEELADEVCRNLRLGRIPTAPGLPFRTNRRRAEEIQSILRLTASREEQFRQLWPRLALLSCWGDAAAEAPMRELQQLFPHVEIQPKGLLATEGFVSLPLCDRPGAALSVRSHFFEFMPTDASSQLTSPHLPRLAHELTKGERYSVILTTGGGLYRYQLRDEVQVVGYEGNCPLLRFVGKADRVCDLVGEKLAEPFVCDVLEQVLQTVQVNCHFAMLIPVDSTPPGYRLLLQSDQLSEMQLKDCADLLEQALCGNPHYRYAVELGQLRRVEAALLSRSIAPRQIQEDACRARGQRLGNVKALVLDRWPGWDSVFREHVIATARANDHNRTTPLSSRGASR